MNPKITKLIDQYLSGALEGEDKLAFETELAQSIELQQEVALQRSIMDAAARASQRREVKDAARRYRRKNLLRNGGISALIAMVIASTVLFFSSASREKEDVSNNEMAPISAETKDKLDKNQDFANIPIQYFQIPSQGTVHISKQGVLISVPEAAFLKDGKPYHGNVILQYQEAIRGVDIIKSGLSTMTGDELLETQGMFSVTGYTEDGEALHFNPEVGVYLQAPVDDCVSGMQLYDGEKKADGTIDWVDPEPLNKIPTLVNMADLDFYPEGYEDYLDKEKWKRDKQSRDSLYLSLEHEMDLNALQNEVINSSQPIGPREEEVVSLEKQMGAVYGDEPKKREPITPLNQAIVWTFSRERVEADIWIITAVANIADGFHISTMDHVDELARTQLKILDSKNLSILEEPTTSSPTRAIQMETKTVQGYTGEVVIKAKVQVKSRKMLRIPVRSIFKVAGKDMEYPRAVRGGYMDLWETPEERVRRYKALEKLKMVGTYILPSNVMAFWQPAFENTLLSTREFERRMAVIHETCDNEVLELYTKNLNKPMSEIDHNVVRMGYPEFQEFADENVGTIDVDDPHLTLLNEFYDKATKMLRKVAKTKVDNESSRAKQWSKIVKKQGEKDLERSRLRNTQYTYNLDNFSRINILRQLGKTQGFKILNGTGEGPTARKNIDALRPYAGIPVVDVQKKTEKAKEKTIIRKKIKYNNLKLRVAEFVKFETVYLYLYADEINSYQRIDPDSNGVAECLLQDDITYAIGVVGITSEGFSYYERDFMKGGNLGEVKLKAISEEALEAKIEKMNAKRLSENLLLSRELDWLRTRQKSYQVRQMFKDMIEFRRELKQLIFPCISFDRNPWLQAEAMVEEEE